VEKDEGGEIEEEKRVEGRDERREGRWRKGVMIGEEGEVM